MRILTRGPLEDFKKKHPDSASSLDSWYVLLTASDFKSGDELRQVFGNRVDVVGRGYVFDISGNKYRLAASIHFNTGRVFIREIMTHAEYSKNAWKQRHQDFH